MKFRVRHRPPDQQPHLVILDVSDASAPTRVGQLGERAHGRDVVLHGDVAAEQQDAVFRPFYTTKPTGQGTGLGLYLSRELARQMDGDLRVLPAEGGSLGWISPEIVVQPFAEAIQKLEKEQYTDKPVQTQFGWHVILLEEKRESPIVTEKFFRAALN